MVHVHVFPRRAQLPYVPLLPPRLIVHPIIRVSTVLPKCVAHPRREAARLVLLPWVVMEEAVPVAVVVRLAVAEAVWEPVVDKQTKI